MQCSSEGSASSRGRLLLDISLSAALLALAASLSLPGVNAGRLDFLAGSRGEELFSWLFVSYG